MLVWGTQCCLADITAAGTLLGHQDQAGASWQHEQYINWQGPTTKAAGNEHAYCLYGNVKFDQTSALLVDGFGQQTDLPCHSCRQAR